jgi:uncharacterized protein YkwD
MVARYLTLRPEVTRLNMIRVMLLFVLWAPHSSPAREREKPPVTPSDLERRVFELINAERVKQHLRPLVSHQKLLEIARAHSRDMAKRGYFDHVTPEGKGPTERGRTAGYECRKQSGNSVTSGLAENLFQNNLYDRVMFHNGTRTYAWNTADEIAESSVKGWMKSSGHRRNILTRNYDLTGIGVAIGADGEVFITQLFC